MSETQPCGQPTLNLTTTEFTLSLLRQNRSQKKLIEMKQKLKYLSFKIVKNTQWSDSVNDQHFNNLMNEVSKMIFKILIEKTRFIIYRIDRLKELQNKKHVRKRIRSQSSNLRLIKKNAKQVIIAKFWKEKEMKKTKWCQFHENLTNETRRDVYSKNCSSSSRKSSHQAAKRVAKKHQYYFRWDV